MRKPHLLVSSLAVGLFGFISLGSRPELASGFDVFKKDQRWAVRNTRGSRWALVGILVLACLTPGPVLAMKLFAGIQEDPGGQTYGRWAAEWWQWAFGVPAATNPVDDLTGANCAERQVDDVWFLAGTFGDMPVVRDCTIPEDTSLFFPLINSGLFAFLNDPPETRTEEFLRAGAACKFPAELFLEVDGKEIDEKDLQRLFTGPSDSQAPGQQQKQERVITPLFNVQLPPGNIFGLDENVIPELVLSPSAEEGYYMFLKPLSPGEHVVHWVATGCFAESALQDITYDLTVEDAETLSNDAAGESAASQGGTGGIRVPGDLRR